MRKLAFAILTVLTLGPALLSSSAFAFGDYGYSHTDTVFTSDYDVNLTMNDGTLYVTFTGYGENVVWYRDGHGGFTVGDRDLGYTGNGNEREPISRTVPLFEHYEGSLQFLNR